MDDETFGSQIQHHMSKHGMSKDTLYATCSVDRRTVERWINDEMHPGPKHLKRLMDALRMPQSERADFIRAANMVTHRPVHQGRTQNIPDDTSFLPKGLRFVGRANETAKLKALLKPGHRPKVVLLFGLPGIGKTSIAGVVIRALKKEGHFPRGVVVVDWTYNNVGNDPAAVLRYIIGRIHKQRQSGWANIDNDDIEALTEALRKMDIANNAIVVLDRVPIDLILDPILHALHEAKINTLIISEHQADVRAEPPDALLHLQDLEESDALELFARSVRYASYEALHTVAPNGPSEIITAVGGHPMAVMLAASLATHSDPDFEVLAQELKADLSPIVESERVQALLRRSLAHLPDGTRNLLHALTAFAGPDVGRMAIEQIAVDLKISGTEIRFHLDHLVRWGLAVITVVETLPKDADRTRVQLHNLVRASAYNVFLLWPPNRKLRLYTAQARYYVRYASHMATTSQSALNADRLNIIGILRSPLFDQWPPAEPNRNSIYGNLCCAMADFWLDRWHVDSSKEFLPKAITAVNQLLAIETSPNKQQEARASLDKLTMAYARVLRRTGEPEKARPLMVTSLQLFQERNDQRGAADTLGRLAHLERVCGRLNQAEDYAKESQHIAEAIGDDSIKGLALAQLGRIARMRGHLQLAEQLFEESIEIFQNQKDTLNEGTARGYLGRIARTRGLWDEARTNFEQSKQLAKLAHDRRGLAIIESQLGRMARVQRKFAQALQHFRRSYQLADMVGDQEAKAVAAGYLGRIARTQGDSIEAEKRFKESLRIAQRIEDRQTESVAVQYLGKVLRDKAMRVPHPELRQRVLSNANEKFKQSLELVLAIGDRRGEGIVKLQLGRTALLTEELRVAAIYLNEALTIAKEVEDLRTVAQTYLALGELAEKANNVDDADTYYHNGYQIAIRTPYPIELDLAEDGLARVSKGASDKDV